MLTLKPASSLDMASKLFTALMIFHSTDVKGFFQDLTHYDPTSGDDAIWVKAQTHDWQVLTVRMTLQKFW